MCEVGEELLMYVVVLAEVDSVDVDTLVIIIDDATRRSIVRRSEEKCRMHQP